MILSNHMVTGAVLAASLNRPELAIPLAFASHFALDSLPHFGYREKSSLGTLLNKQFPYVVLCFEIAAIIVLMAVLWGQSWWLLAAALVAASPDSVLFYHFFLFEIRGKPIPQVDPVTRFHRFIQWCERPWGFGVEILYFLVMFSILVNKLH